MQRDLARGKKGESKVSDIFEKHSYAVECNTTKGGLADYDIKVSLTDTWTIEVKNDEYAKRSGNIAIEVFNPKSNKASGVMITKAQLWAHVLEDEVWITSVERLINFTKTAIPHKIIERAGDGNATLLLYKKDHILNEIFKRIDDLDKSEMELAIGWVLGK